MRDGDILIGWGMATATYPGYRQPAQASAKLFADGHLEAYSATQDIGTGTYTIMAQIAAEAMGVPIQQTQFQLGDTPTAAARRSPAARRRRPASVLPCAMPAWPCALRWYRWQLPTGNRP